MLNVCYHDHITACSGIAQTNARTGWQRGKLLLVNFFSLHVWSGNTWNIDIIVVSSTQHLQLWLFHFFLEWFVTLSTSNPPPWVFLGPSLEPSLVACSCITCDLHPPYHSDHLRSTCSIWLIKYIYVGETLRKHWGARIPTPAFHNPMSLKHRQSVQVYVMLE